jgi:hydrogenase maturation protease
VRTLVVGLGNPVLSDDGVGPHVAAELKGKLEDNNVTIIEANISGLNLLDLLAGYDRAIIIDAIQTVGGKAGQIYRLAPSSLGTTNHAISSHDANLVNALKLGCKLGLTMPQEVVIFAIEAADMSTFSEECTPKVRRAIPVCVELVIRELTP